MSLARLLVLPEGPHSSHCYAKDHVGDAYAFVQVLCWPWIGMKTNLCPSRWVNIWQNKCLDLERGIFTVIQSSPRHWLIG